VELSLGASPQAKNVVYMSKPVSNVIDEIVAGVEDTIFNGI